MDPITVGAGIAVGSMINNAMGDPADLSGGKQLSGTQRQSPHVGRLIGRANEYQLGAQDTAQQSQQMTNPFIKNLMDQMALTASGQGPTAASAMLEATRGQNMANWNAMQASQRGLASPGQAAHSSANQLAMSQQQAASKIAPFAIQEKQQAQGMLGNMISQQQQYELNMRNLSKQYMMMGYDMETARQKAENAANLMEAQAQLNLRNAGIQGGINMMTGGMNAGGQSPMNFGSDSSYDMPSEGQGYSFK